LYDCTYFVPTCLYFYRTEPSRVAHHFEAHESSFQLVLLLYWTKSEELVTEESQPPKFRKFCYKKGCATTGFKLVPVGDVRVVGHYCSLYWERRKRICYSGFLYIPNRFLVGRNETSSKITGDHDFALDYYVDSFLLGLNLSHHSNPRIINLRCNRIIHRHLESNRKYEVKR
jgi:hypothetical protein